MRNSERRIANGKWNSPRHQKRWAWLIGGMLLLGGLFSSTTAQLYRRPPELTAEVNQRVLENVDIKQKLNAQVPLDLTFRDETGNTVRLGDYFGKRPVILTMNYYECPMLCTVVLNELTRALNAIEYRIGKDFEVVTVSIAPNETPQLAAKKKANYVKAYRYGGAEKGWHFLTGEEANIRRLADAVGFQYVYDPRTKQYAHTAAIMILTPDGRLSRYLLGVMYAPRDLEFALMEASEGKIGNPVKRVVLYCYQYDPSTGKYGLVILRLVQVGGVLTVLALGLLIGGLLWLERRRPRTGDSEMANGEVANSEVAKWRSGEKRVR
ncbi:MAG: SCO family protein [Armatimonadota bacterium]